MPWRLDPRYVREDCYDEQLLEGTLSHVDDLVEARFLLLVHRPTAGQSVAGFPRLHVLETQDFIVPSKDGARHVPALWIVYVLIPEELLIRPLYITKATRANADLRQLAEQALVHFRRANIHS